MAGHHTESNTLLWEDTFDGTEGTLPDPAAWNVMEGNADTNGWGNQELQWYRGDPANLAHDGEGHLAIVAQASAPGEDLPCWNGASCPYTSARITTRGKVELLYGRAEARIRFPEGRGLWPAFWMMGTNGEGWPRCGEIDIVELVGSKPGEILGTLHGPGYSGGASLSNYHHLAERFTSGFHTYGVEKHPNLIRWYVDDTEYGRLTPESLPDGAAWVFEQPFYLLLNLAVGGHLPGSPDASTSFPATMLVDHVRLFGSGTAP